MEIWNGYCGSGDALTGILAALLAQGLPPQVAAVLGVYLHARVESLLLRKILHCVIASDIIGHFRNAYALAMDSESI